MEGLSIVVADYFDQVSPVDDVHLAQCVTMANMYQVSMFRPWERARLLAINFFGHMGTLFLAIIIGARRNESLRSSVATSTRSLAPSLILSFIEEF